ncbi:MAG: o-succinylbenzoate--CoA ligase [Chloroflexi bacterium]|nr:o-succinylbenzoate--CoA ligase [Chloroflexota bacterium]
MAGLKARVNHRPDKIFLAHGDLGMSFAYANQYASRACAAILRHTPLEPGDRAAILMKKPVPFILTLFALMRMRVVSVPLNTRLTASELAWQIQNVDCRLTICEPETRALAGEAGANVMEMPNIDLEEPAPQYGDFGMMNLDDDFAIIHTSGTSGRPKAAILTYGNVYQSAVASALKLDTIRGEQWLCPLPLYHVGGLSIVFRSLNYGTAIEVLPPGPFDVRETNRILSEHPITIVSLVPTMLQRLLDAKTRPWNPRLRLILLGGEAPSPELLARCAAENLPIATTYGLTETASQVATAWPELVYRKPGTVGKPLDFTQVRIIDEGGDDAAPNVPGEVLVKGETVMRGYCNNPAATAKALRDGWLHTGDIGYLDEDGDLFILQRREDLIVSGGENIYPAEVEDVLRKHPAIAEAVVLALPDANWGQRVAAAIETRPGQSATVEEIRAFARNQLAGYKVPRQIVFVAALPRTASGKLQRREARKAFPDAPHSKP